MKQFNIPCTFGDATSVVGFYIGAPEPTHHPIGFQSKWLTEARGGSVPQEFMDTLDRLHKLALDNNTNFEELCYYALISATKHSLDDKAKPDPDNIAKYAEEFLTKSDTGQQTTVQINDSSAIEADNQEDTNTSLNNDNQQVATPINDSSAIEANNQETTMDTVSSNINDASDSTSVADANEVNENASNANQATAETTPTTAVDYSDDDLLLSDDIQSQPDIKSDTNGSNNTNSNNANDSNNTTSVICDSDQDLLM